MGGRGATSKFAGISQRAEKYRGKTFKQILKNELEMMSVPVEKSTERKNGRLNFTTRRVEKEGVRIERQLMNTQRGSNRDKEEVITIYTQGHMSEKQMKKLTEEIKKIYTPKLSNPYIKKTSIYIF